MSRIDPANAPESLFVGIQAVSDASPFWFDYVLDVMPGTDTAHVTLLRIAPLDNVCTDRITVKAKEATISVEPIRKLTTGLCSVNPGDVERAVANSRATTMSSIFESASYEIVMKCGGSENVVQLPMPEGIDRRKMHRSYPTANERACFDCSAQTHDRNVVAVADL